MEFSFIYYHSRGQINDYSLDFIFHFSFWINSFSLQFIEKYVEEERKKDVRSDFVDYFSDMRVVSKFSFSTKA